jgi:hypothetical protein
MCGTISTARQAGGNTRHAVRSTGAAERIPPLVDSQGNDVTGRWPLRSFLELGALPGAMPCARLHTRHLLWEWQLTALADTAELLVSEIITNAIQVTQADARTAPVRLWLLADRARLLILVWDASPLPRCGCAPATTPRTAAACCWWTPSAHDGTTSRTPAAGNRSGHYLTRHDTLAEPARKASE